MAVRDEAWFREMRDSYLSGEVAEEVWACVRNLTHFNRRVLEEAETGGMGYNRRLLHLLMVAMLRRVEHLVEEPEWTRLLVVLDDYADGRADEDQFFPAVEEAEGIPRGGPATRHAALEAIMFLGDDYKLIRGVNAATFAGGCVAAIEAGELAKGADIRAALALRESPSFRSGVKAENLAICALIRDVFGDPFDPPAIAPECLAWKGGTVPRMAREIHDERRFGDLPILADALEDAGCSAEAVLRHCRGPGPHVRGCWVVDLALGKD